MGEGKNMFGSKNTSLDVIMEILLNNDEFLNRIADKVWKKYLKNRESCDVNHVFDDNTQDIKQETKYWGDEVSASSYDGQDIEKSGIKFEVEEVEIDRKNLQIENLNEEIIQLNKKVERLVSKNNELVKEKSNLMEQIDQLKIILNDADEKNKKLIDINDKKDQEISNLKNKQNIIENNLRELKHKNEALTEKLTISENKYYEVEAKKKQILDMKNQDLQKKDIELEEKQNVILSQQSEISSLQSEFSSIKESYNLFLSLNDEIKNDMISILRGDKIENFVYAGVQYKNIESIWEYAKNRAINGQLEDLDKLEKIIMNFLDAYNMTYNSPLYEVQIVENGDDFDEEKFIRGYESRITGVISGVDLLGYVNLINGKIIKKSVVRI